MSPRPGSPVRGSRTGRPVMALLDLLGRRWVLRIIWELTRAGAGFRALQERCGEMSPSVLAQRLRELGEAGIVGVDEAGSYRLTAAGRSLARALAPVDAWAKQWARSREAGASPGKKAGQGAGDTHRHI